MYYLNIQDYGISCNSLFWQLLTGHKYNTPLWYMYVLIILTIVFSLMFGLFKDKYNIVLGVILICSLIHLYTGGNALFYEMRMEMKWTLGRIAEMLPYSSIGLLLGINKEKIKKMELQYKVGVLIIAAAMWKICQTLEQCGILVVEFNYGYAGMELLFKSVLIFLACLFLSEIEINKMIECVIRKINYLTMGIYCIHILIGECILIFEDRKEIIIEGFQRGIIIFIVSYIFCWGISKIPIRGIRNIVS